MLVPTRERRRKLKKRRHVAINSAHIPYNILKNKNIIVFNLKYHLIRMC